MNWVETYVGTPYLSRGRTLAGLDCWGLIRSVYATELAVFLPEYTGYSHSEDKHAVGAIVDFEMASARNESNNWRKVDKLEQYDLIVFNLAGKPSHVGVAVNAHTFMHTLRGRNATVERISNVLWRNRVQGFYKYVETGVPV